MENKFAVNWSINEAYFDFKHWLHCVSSIPDQDMAQRDATTAVKHCHDNSHAQEDREREKKAARKQLYVASVICLIFMIGEVVGESLLGPSSLSASSFFWI